MFAYMFGNSIPNHARALPTLCVSASQPWQCKAINSLLELSVSLLIGSSWWGSASQNLLPCQNSRYACHMDLFMEYSRLLCLVALTSSCFPLSFVRILRCPLFPRAFPQLAGSVTNVFAIHLPESFGAFHSVREAHKAISCMPAASGLHLLQYIRHRVTCCNTSGIMQHATNSQGAHAAATHAIHGLSGSMQ